MLDESLHNFYIYDKCKSIFIIHIYITPFFGHLLLCFFWRLCNVVFLLLPFRLSKMEFFIKIVNGFQWLTIFAKSSILDIWLGSETTSAHKIILCKRNQSQSHAAYLVFLNFYVMVCEIFWTVVDWYFLWQGFDSAFCGPRDHMATICRGCEMRKI